MPNLMSNVDVGSMALMRKLGFLSHCSQIRVKLCDRVNVAVKGSSNSSVLTVNVFTYKSS